MARPLQKLGDVLQGRSGVNRSRSGVGTLNFAGEYSVKRRTKATEDRRKRSILSANARLEGESPRKCWDDISQVLFWVFLGLLVFSILVQSSRAFAAKSRGVRARAGQADQGHVAALKPITMFGNLPVPFHLGAVSALLMDATTGAILYAYGEHEPVQPASLAKLMTFYLVLEALQTGRTTLDSQVMISEKAWRLSMNAGVSRMFLREGQSVSIQDLLYGMMVSSGNDAAVALAEHVSGSSDGFTELMNEKAKELGLMESHFTNPDGLPSPGQYTTAHDMAILARAILSRYPEAVAYTGAKEFTFQKIRQPNFNSLLFHDARVDGLKTGHVRDAGYHLVATAHEGGMRLIAILLGAADGEKRRMESGKLLAWGFRTFTTVRFDWSKDIPEDLPVYGGDIRRLSIAPVAPPQVTILKGHERNLDISSAFPSKHLVAPIAKDATVGELMIRMNGNCLASIPIKTQTAAGPGSFFIRTIDRVKLAWWVLFNRMMDHIRSVWDRFWRWF